MRAFRFFVALILANLCITALSAQDSLHYKNGWILTRFYPLNNFDTIIQHFDAIFPYGPYTAGEHVYGKNFTNVDVTDSTSGLIAIRDSVEGEIWTFDSLGQLHVDTQQFAYSSGLLHSKEVFRYGQFEITFKSNRAHGTVGAFWLFGDDSEEIDVFEIRGTRVFNAQMTLHWKDRDPLTRSKQSIYDYPLDSGDFSDSFRTMGVIWSENSIYWTFEGDTVYTDPITDFIRRRHVPKNLLNIIMTLEVGTSDGPPDTTAFPDSIYYKDLKAYTDTLGIPNPSIVKQKEVLKDFTNDFTLSLSDVEVNDAYGVYPNGFRLRVLEPDSNQAYQLLDGKIVVDNSILEELFIPIQVDNGILYSDTFLVRVENKHVTGIKKRLSELLHHVTYRNGVLYVQNNGADDIRLRVLNYNGKVLSQWGKIAADASIGLPLNQPVLLLQVEQKGVVASKTIGR